LLRVAVEQLERYLRRLLKQFALIYERKLKARSKEAAEYFVRSHARNSVRMIRGSLDSNKPKLTYKSLPSVNVPYEAVEGVSENSTNSGIEEDEPTDL
jgi:hypothetical protein